VSWGPFLLALALGLIVSAGIYIGIRWPAAPDPESPSDERP
jgi:hypothetical protein